MIQQHHHGGAGFFFLPLLALPLAGPDAGDVLDELGLVKEA